MPIEGMQAYLDGNQDLKELDISRDLMYISTLETPVSTLLQAMNARKETTSMEYQWAEKDYLKYKTTVNGAHAGGATAITLTDASFVNVNDTILFTNAALTLHEVNRVVSKAGNVVTLVRDIGGTGAGAALSGGEEAIVIGYSMDEGGSAADAIRADYDKKYGYCQIFSTTTNFSDVAEITPNGPGGDRETAIMEAGETHKQKIERAFLLGKLDQETTGGKTHWYTNSIHNMIATHITPIGGTMTKTQFHTFLKPIFDYGSDTKYLFTGNGVYDAIQSYAESKLTADMLEFTFNGQRAFGYQINRYDSPYGRLIIIRHRMLRGNYNGHAYLVDMDYLKERYLRTKDTVLRRAIQPANEHNVKDEWYTITGLEMRNEIAHGMLTGVTGGA